MKFVPILRGWLLPILSGFLLAVALPPFDQGQVGWIALIPFFFAIEGCSRPEAFRRGYLAGVVFFGMTTWWIIHVSLPGMVALIAFLALYFGGAGVFLNLFGKNETDSVTRNLGVAFAGAAGWVTLEWIRGHFPLGGFGWNGLGVTQHSSVPLIQFAGITGVYGVSALVFVLNYALFCTVRRFVDRQGMNRRLSWEFYVAMSLVCAAVLYGFRELRPGQPTGALRPLRLALVQGNIPQSLKFDEREKPMILDRYRSLTETATLTKVDLVIWPETATPDALRYEATTYGVVTAAAAQAKAYLLTGTIDLTPHSEPVEAFNAAALVRPDGSVPTVYRKTRLVPFGEYVPLRKIMPFFKWFTPITDSFERGREYTMFNVHGLDFGTVICFEDTLPHVYRRFVKAGAEFMVNLTNDAWFKDSPAAEIHLANAVFRTVENRRWLVRATNHGVTCVVSPLGFVQPRADIFQATWLPFVLLVPTELPATFYTEHGDVFVAGCAVVAILGLLVAWRMGAFRLESRA
ncbi:MAG: Apolipoprotein N-acyltransferase [Verrucomicrobiae bacterium]|nr:Apolipoprotein N-acyltransferase [Verrucomicrobiae bacterium]